jgi:hypothetical protein
MPYYDLEYNVVGTPDPYHKLHEYMNGDDIG